MNDIIIYVNYTYSTKKYKKIMEELQTLFLDFCLFNSIIVSDRNYNVLIDILQHNKSKILLIHSLNELRNFSKEEIEKILTVVFEINDGMLISVSENYLYHNIEDISQIINQKYIY